MTLAPEWIDYEIKHMSGSQWLVHWSPIDDEGDRAPGPTATARITLTETAGGELVIDDERGAYLPDWLTDLVMDASRARARARRDDEPDRAHDYRYF